MIDTFVYNRSGGITNVGDEITKFVLKDCIQTIPFISSYSFSGSILNSVLDKRRSQKVEIYGSGFIKKPLDICSSELIDIKFVRGKLTAKILDKPKSLLCDFGLMMPHHYTPPQKKIIGKKDLCFVPHYIHENLFRGYNQEIISTSLNPEDFIRKINEYKLIISSSLHGIILSDAYGIPNVWVDVIDKPLNSEFKFHDYFSSFNYDRKVVKISCNDDLSKLVEYQQLSHGANDKGKEPYDFLKNTFDISKNHENCI